MKEVTARELKKMLDDNEDFVLIDVREPFEFDEANLNGKLIPMGEVMNRMDEIPKDKKVVIHCKSGGRSGSVVHTLESKGYDNLYNLRGGIMAWMNEVGPPMNQE